MYPPSYRCVNSTARRFPPRQAAWSYFWRQDIQGPYVANGGDRVEGGEANLDEAMTFRVIKIEFVRACVWSVAWFALSPRPFSADAMSLLP